MWLYGQRGHTHVVQLVEHWTVNSPVRQEIFFPESTFSADSLSVSIHPRVQSLALTPVCMIKIL